jgi:hypothetical protein
MVVVTPHQGREKESGGGTVVETEFGESLSYAMALS